MPGFAIAWHSLPDTHCLSSTAWYPQQHATCPQGLPDANGPSSGSDPDVITRVRRNENGNDEEPGAAGGAGGGGSWFSWLVKGETGGAGGTDRAAGEGGVTLQHPPLRLQVGGLLCRGAACWVCRIVRLAPACLLACPCSLLHACSLACY